MNRSKSIEIVRSLSRLFNRKDRIKLSAILFLHFCLGVLDLVGVVLLGAVIALTVSPEYFSSNQSLLRQMLNFLDISSKSQQEQLVLVGAIASVILVTRSVLTYMVSIRVVRFFVLRAAKLSSDLLDIVMQKGLNFINRSSLQKYIYVINDGAALIMVRGISSSVVLFSDLVLFFVFAIGFFILNPVMSLVSLLFFGLLIAAVHLLTTVRNLQLSRKSFTYTVGGRDLVESSLKSFREIAVKNRQRFIVRRFSENREEFARIQTAQSTIAYIPKSVMEIGLVVGSVLIGVVAFTTQPPPRAILLVSIFLMASARLIPAILRAQQGYASIRSALASSEMTLTLIKAFSIEQSPSKKQSKSESTKAPSLDYDGFTPNIIVDNVSFAYDESKNSQVANVSFKIQSGEFCAVIGKSGSGKSTLIDLVLGLQKPSNGSIQVSGLPPADAIEIWPGSVAYVPQNVGIIDGTLVENICLGYDAQAVPESHIVEILQRVGLSSLLDQTEGLQYRIGSGGNPLSGGQKQRVGIARALISNPKLIVLDEPTSSLDMASEERVINEILKMKGDATIIMVAHRLATVQKADKILYLRKGRLKDQGTYEDIRARNPEILKQAKLMSAKA